MLLAKEMELKSYQMIICDHSRFFKNGTLDLFSIKVRH